jgi:hypothetical protein
MMLSLGGSACVAANNRQIYKINWLVRVPIRFRYRAG